MLGFSGVDPPAAVGRGPLIIQGRGIEGGRGGGGGGGGGGEANVKDTTGRRSREVKRKRKEEESRGEKRSGGERERGNGGATRRSCMWGAGGTVKWHLESECAGPSDGARDMRFVTGGHWQRGAGRRGGAL
eukprot:2696343-Rhodomonas_salina.2